MAYIRLIRKALIEHYAPILSSSTLEEAQLNAMMLTAKPVVDAVRKIWVNEGTNSAERMWLEMQRQKGVKSLGRHSKQWIEYITKFLTEDALNKLSFQILNTTKNWMVKRLIEASAEGYGIEWLVREMTGNFTRKRARTIARTETIRARNAGFLAAADQLPYQAIKIWNSAQDARTRNTKQADHLHMNLQEREINEYFVDERSQALMMCPGDNTSETVTGADVINCRCRVTFRAKRDENGRIIMK